MLNGFYLFHLDIWELSLSGGAVIGDCGEKFLLTELLVGKYHIDSVSRISATCF